MEWIVSYRHDVFDLDKAFKTNGTVDWLCYADFHVGDIVYIYETLPGGKIIYQTVVQKFIDGNSEDATRDNEFFNDANRRSEDRTKTNMVRLSLTAAIPENPVSLIEMKKYEVYPPKTARLVPADFNRFLINRFSEISKPEPKPHLVNAVIGQEIVGVPDDLKVVAEEYRDNGSLARLLISKFADSDFIFRLHDVSMKFVMLVYTGKLLREEQRSIVLASLAMISINSYDGDFWSAVHRTYSRICEHQIPLNKQKIDNSIRLILLRGFENHYRTDTRKISIPIMAGIISLPLINDFIDFVYSLYELNFEFEYEPSDKYIDDALEELLLTLKKVGESHGTENDLKVAVPKTALTVTLSKYIVSDIENDLYHNDLKYIMGAYLKKIAAYHWNETVPNFGKFYDDSFSKWIDYRKSSDRKITSKARAETDKSVASQSIWTPHFVWKKDGKFYLRAAKQRIPNDIDIETLRVAVACGSKKLDCNPNFALKNGILCYLMSNIDDVEISNIVNGVSYSICDKNKTIYDSGTRLNFDYVFFDENGNQIFSEQDYTGSVHCVSKIKPDGVKFISCVNRGPYYESQFLVDPSTIVSFEEKKAFFSSFSKPGLFGKLTEDVSFVKSDCVYNVYSSVERINFETIKEPAELALLIDGKRVPLINCKYYVLRSGLVNKISLSLFALSSGFHNVAIEESSVAKALPNCDFLFFLDSSINVCEIHEKRGVVFSATGVGPITLLLSNDDDYGLVNLPKWDGAFRVYPAEPVYCFGDFPKFRMRGETIRSALKDQSLLYLHSGFGGTLRFSPSDDCLANIVLPPVKEDDHVGSYSVEPLLGMLASHECLNLTYETNSGLKYVLKIHSHSFIPENGIEATFDEEKCSIQIDGTFVGDGPMLLSVSCGQKAMLETEVVQNSFTFAIPDCLPYLTYSLVIKTKPDIFNGLDPYVVFKRDYCFVSFSRMTNKYFTVRQINCESSLGNRTIEISIPDPPVLRVKGEKNGTYICHLFHRGWINYQNLKAAKIVSCLELWDKGLLVKMADLNGNPLLYNNRTTEIFDGHHANGYKKIESVYIEFDKGDSGL